MSKIGEIAVVFILAATITGTGMGLSFDRPQPEEFEEYSSDTDRDLEEEIKEKVNTTQVSDGNDIEEELEEKVDQKTEELKQENSKGLTSQAAESKPKGFFSALMNIFG